MGHKKRNVAPRSKAAQSPSAVDGVGGPVGAADGGVSNPPDQQSPDGAARAPGLSEAVDSGGIGNANPYPSDAAVKLECERALTALRRGNHTKALRLMKDLGSKYENSPNLALIHRVQGTVCVKVASIIDDTNAKQRHLKNAIDSAKKAVSLSPNSIEFAHFYANLLYETANEAKEYEEVVVECERALAIENPVDPAKESLQDENQQKISTTEARVAHVQSELRSLIQKSNIASISTWMKNLGNGEEKFRLIPIRRVPEDPMELRLVQTRRPNEIKKVAKTPEERRKEIEVRVAAARLLQQKSESSQLKNDGDNVNNNIKGLDSGPGSGLRTGERRRSGNIRKTASSDERRDWVRSYWNSMPSEGKKELLKIKVSDLKTHFSSLKDGSVSEVLTEALSFGEAHIVWRFWMCCRCNDKFDDASSFMQHTVQEHVGSLPPKSQSVLPQIVESEWAEMLLHCSWKALDLNAAIRMLEKGPTSSTPDESCPIYDDDNSNECFVDTYNGDHDSNSSHGKKKAGYNCNGSVQVSREFEGVEWMDCDGDLSSKGSLLHENWPASHDPDRSKLLEKVHAIFEALIKHKYLASSHLSKVINYAVEELQGISCGSKLNSNMEQTPLCICFLGAEELKKILKFLQEISQSCGLNRYSDKSNVGEESNTGVKSVESVDTTEKIIFSQDVSYLMLDEHFLPCKVSHSSSETSTPPTSSYISYENGVLDSDALLSWIFTGASSGEQLTSWKRVREEKAQQGLEILQLLEKESFHLQSLCDRKVEHLNYEEALQAVEDLCLEEGKKRECIADYASRSYDTVLKKRREELIEIHNENTIISNRFELDAITNVLKDAESLNVNQFGFEENYGGVTSHLCDLEAGEEDDWRTRDCLHQVDSCIEVAIQRQKEQVSIELSKIDGRIMRVVAGMQQLEVKLEPASSHDFRSILIPLVKSFMRARLEDLAEKDATEKSDAAREAFLAELALDSKKGVGAGVDSSKHIHERTKDKKKSKENRKSKDMKVTYNDELQDQIAEGMVLQNAEDEDSSGSGIGTPCPGPDEALLVEEEEYKRRIELEAEERKLEETLEYQRCIENEAKQKHLAEQNKKFSKTSNITESVDLETSYLSPGNDDKYAIQQLTNRKDPFVHNGGVSNNSEDTPKNCANGDTLETGVLSIGVPPDNGLFTARRSGRRGRRHRGPSKVADEKPLAEKEDNDASQPKFNLNSNDDADNGTKTLKQIKVDEEDDERFQADLKKAVHQSLVMSEDGNGVETYGTGLKNEVGEYNCFLNVIIQSLWHLRRFRDEFLLRSSSGHVHVGDPCVICALYGIFVALSVSSKDNRREAVAPTSLRVALSNLYPDSNFFQEGQMNDASEVLGVLFNCLHRSFTVASVASDTESADSDSVGSWDCNNGSCIAHSIFGMDIFERMNCYNCGLESRYLKYTSFFHNINASALRIMKGMYPGKTFDELLNLVEMNHRLACDTDAGGCGKSNHIHHILSSVPHVFTAVLGWQNTSESIEDIKKTLAALSTEIDVSVLYRGLDPQNSHGLVSVVCYYGQHYHCFAYSRDHEQWIMYDDKTVKVIGSWNDVLFMCERGHLQPQLLLYEAVN